MRVAIGCYDGLVDPKLGETREFMIYQIENNKIVKSQLITADGIRFANIAYLLHDLKVDTVITGGMGKAMKIKLDNLQIEYYSSVSGNVDDVIRDFLHQNLQYDNSNITKRHHL